MEDQDTEINEVEKYIKPSKFKWLKKGVSVTFFLAFSFGMFYVGNLSATKGFFITKIPTKVAGDLSKIDDGKKYSDLFALRNLIMSKYDGEINDSALLEGSMKGMASALGDPYTVYMNSQEYKKFVNSDNNFSGIGAHIGVKDDKVVVISAMEGSPAEDAGIRNGDIILKVDDYDVTEPNSELVASKIRGEKGAPVTLTIQRGEDVIESKIVREEIKTESVKGQMIEDNIGYIQITTFSDDKVSSKFSEKLNELKRSGMGKLILDLRGNPGGYLDKSVDVVSNFIPKGELVTYTVDKYKNKQESFSKGGDAIGMPLVVLVDNGSASASEIVTGALKDHKVATVIGKTTFGKGIVQQLIPFKESTGEIGALKVTTSKYYCPDGENIHGIGITPDIEVELGYNFFLQKYSKSLDSQFQKALEVIRTKTQIQGGR